MQRRHFLAALLAPFLSRIFPKRIIVLKPRSVGLSTLANSNYLAWYLHHTPTYKFGWTGYKNAVANIDTAGSYLLKGNADAA